jgi:hypothetical protein
MTPCSCCERLVAYVSQDSCPRSPHGGMAAARGGAASARQPSQQGGDRSCAGAAGSAAAAIPAAQQRKLRERRAPPQARLRAPAAAQLGQGAAPPPPAPPRPPTPVRERHDGVEPHRLAQHVREGLEHGQVARVVRRQVQPVHVHHQVRAVAPEGAPDLAQHGVVARLAGGGDVQPGRVYQVQVDAVHPPLDQAGALGAAAEGVRGAGLRLRVAALLRSSTGGGGGAGCGHAAQHDHGTDRSLGAHGCRVGRAQSVECQRGGGGAGGRGQGAGRSRGGESAWCGGGLTPAEGAPRARTCWSSRLLISSLLPLPVSPMRSTLMVRPSGLAAPYSASSRAASAIATRLGSGRRTCASTSSGSGGGHPPEHQHQHQQH